MSYFTSGFLLAAKVFGAKDWSHPKIIKLARDMAHAGATLEEIHAATGWACKKPTATARLRKLNITPSGSYAVLHRGEIAPYLNEGAIDQRAFRARTIR